MNRKDKRKKAQAAAPTNNQSIAPAPTVASVVPPPSTEARQGQGETDLDAHRAYEAYIKHRDLLIKTEHDNTEQHDKAILQLSAWALALTVTFLEKIAPDPVAGSRFWLGAGWVFLITSMTLMVFSFLTGQWDCQLGIFLHDEQYENRDNPEYKPTKENRWCTWTTVLNFISFCCFLVGIICIVWFSWKNIDSKTSNNTPTPNVQQPAPVSPPQDTVPATPTVSLPPPSTTPPATTTTTP